MTNNRIQDGRVSIRLLRRLGGHRGGGGADRVAVQRARCPHTSSMLRWVQGEGGGVVLWECLNPCVMGIGYRSRLLYTSTDVAIFT